MLKRKFLSLLLVIICYCNICFSAIVSDNDGSAFITKAEFDSLKNGFQMQINNYNSSIDSKIDGAIAGYLSGVNVSTEPDNLFSKFVINSGAKPVWHKTLDGGSTSTQSFSYTATLTEKVRTCNNITPIAFRGSSADGYVMIGIFEDLSQFTTDWAKKCIRYLKSGTRDKQFSTMGWTSTTGWDSTTYPPKYGINYYSQQINNVNPGDGKKWIYQIKNGRKCLKYFCPKYYVENTLVYEGMYYLNFNIVSNQAPYFADNGKKTTSTLTTYTIEGMPGVKTSKGTKFIPTSATTDGVYIELESHIEKVTDGNNYLNNFFSIDTDVDIYAQDEEYNGTAPASTDPEQTITIPDQQFYDIYYTTGAGQLQTNTVSGTSINYKPVKIANDTTTKLSTYCNNIASSVAGESVYHGGGMPIMETTDDEFTLKIGIKLKASSNVDCEIKISDNQFSLGSVKPGSHLLGSTNITTNNPDYVYYSFTVPKKGVVWLFLKNITNDIPITIDDIIIG